MQVYEWPYFYRFLILYFLKPAAPYTLKKSLGQHFLHDEAMCGRIVASVTHTPGMNLLEVGPGGGAITKYFIEWQDVHYKAVEIDAEKVTFLNATYPVLEGKIIQEDVLRMVQPFDGKFSIAGNFPYNISSPILFRVLEWEKDVAEVTGMFQKEVAQRIASGPGSKQYGILSVLMQAFFNVEHLFDVPPQSFTPAPAVMSGVVRFTNINNPHGIENKKAFTRLIKAAFSQRRKTLRNALRGTLPDGPLTTDPIMGKRAEQLAVSDFVRLYNEYMQ